MFVLTYCGWVPRRMANTSVFKPAETPPPRRNAVEIPHPFTTWVANYEYCNDTIASSYESANDSETNRQAKDKRKSQNSSGTADSRSNETQLWCPKEERCIYVDPEYRDPPIPSVVTTTCITSTIANALERFRSSRNTNQPYTTIVLAGGTHYLNQTILLNASDSGLRVTHDPRQEKQPWISGGRPIPREMLKQHGTKPFLWTADLSAVLFG